MRYLFFIVLLVAVAITAGCIDPNVKAVVTPTPQIVYVTVTVTPTPSPTTALKTILFSDDLSRWRSEWDQLYDGYEGKTFYSGGSLHIRDNDSPGRMYQKLNKNFSDFILDVDTNAVAGSINNYQGVIIRGQDDNNYYGLDISADGYYEILKFENGNRNSLAGSMPTRSSYINTSIGALNRIHVEAKGNTLSLSVNGHHLYTVIDNTFKEGTVRLTVNSLSSSNSFSEVVFNNLVITTI